MSQKKQQNRGCGCLLLVIVLVSVFFYASRNAPVASTANGAFNEATYASLLQDNLRITARGRTFGTVSVADGRENDGERVAIIPYTTAETSDSAIIDDAVNILEGVITIITAHSLDIDAVFLSIGNEDGDAIAGISVSITDLRAWYREQITRREFESRLAVVDF